MRLNEQDYNLFLKLYQPLIFYAGQKQGVVDKKLDFETWKTTQGTEGKYPCREAFLENPGILKEFIQANPQDFSNEELDMLRQFRHKLAGDFYLFKYLKPYTVFLGNEVAYGVKALTDPFESFFGPTLPVWVKTVLLPFKGQIIYDGFLQSYNIYFGGGIKRSLNQTYKEAKLKYGIVTTLPFDNRPVYEKMLPEERLSYFLANKANREEFEEKTIALLKKQPQLQPFYHKEWGKIHAIYYKKKFKSLGLNKAYYAILEGQIIGSAFKKEDLDKTLAALVPKRKMAWVYVFRM